MTLTNEQINLTYPGLIKTTDNAALDPTVEKALTDGVGNNMPMTASQAGISFNGNLDLANATVTGLSAGGLVAGDSGTNAMQSAAFLTNTPATANGGDAIALGDGANATSLGIAIGVGTTAQNGPAISIGRYSTASGSVSLAMGNSANVQGDNSIGLSGEVINVSNIRVVGIGRQVTVSGYNSTGIGNYATVTGNKSLMMASSGVGIGTVAADNSINLAFGEYGTNIPATAPRAIGIGASAISLDKVTAADGIAIGTQSTSTAVGAVSLGREIVANTVDTVSVRELETQTIGGGVTMFSPNGTGYKVTVTDGGLLTVTAI